jgi:hypothetical protein
MLVPPRVAAISGSMIVDICGMSQPRLDCRAQGPALTSQRNVET